MSVRSIHQYVAIIAISCITIISHAQTGQTGITENKPYKILTSGKQITVKSTKNIKNIMVWTASGHRIVEQKAVNASSYTFNINVSEKIFFVMIEYEGSKPYTEKIGI
jgi:hypothetical protein